MSVLRWTTKLLIFVGLFSLPVQAIPPPTAQDLAAATKRFNRIAWPNLRGKSYVEIPLGGQTENGQTTPLVAVRGFLLSENGDSWLLLPIGIRSSILPYAVQRIPKRAGQATEVRILSLNEVINKMIQVLQDPTKRGDKPSAATVFAFARFCEYNGSPDLAMRLDKVIPAQPDHTLGASFGKHVIEEVAMLLMWKAITDFGNPSISRADLLAQVKFVADHFPESGHWKLACSYSEMLPEMIEEDRGHAPKPFSTMTPQEKIDEYIFQLRNQNGYQFGQPGHCDIFGWPRNKGDTAAHELLKMSYTAVPSLIEAMTDGRPTRSVGFHRDFYFSHYVLTVGDCAEQILSRLAGREFFYHGTTTSSMTKDGGTQYAQKAASEWWTGMKAKGEKAILIEGIQEASLHSREQARRLMAMDSTSAVKAIEQAISAAQRPEIAVGLIGVLGTDKSERTTDLLKREMREGKSLGVRVASAEQLLARRDEDCVAAMIGEWRRWEPQRFR